MSKRLNVKTDHVWGPGLASVGPGVQPILGIRRAPL